jgi:hypothetical protein
MENGVCCADHWAEAQEKFAFWDHHSFAGFCLMPGTNWVASWEEAPGACVLALSDEGVQDVLVAMLEQPASAPVEVVGEP